MSVVFGDRESECRRRTSKRGSGVKPTIRTGREFVVLGDREGESLCRTESASTEDKIGSKVVRPNE